jgi:hypothetical protein
MEITPSPRRIVGTIGIGLCVVGGLILAGGVVNLALAPSRTADAKLAMASLASIGMSPYNLPPVFALQFFMASYWLPLVSVQLALSALLLLVGVRLLQRRSWARTAAEILGWSPAGSLAIASAVWLATWLAAAATDREWAMSVGMAGLRMWLGPCAGTVMQFLVGPAVGIAWVIVARAGFVAMPTNDLVPWITVAFALTIAAAAVALVLRLPVISALFRAAAPIHETS